VQDLGAGNLPRARSQTSYEKNPKPKKIEMSLAAKAEPVADDLSIAPSGTTGGLSQQKG